VRLVRSSRNGYSSKQAKWIAECLATPSSVNQRTEHGSILGMPRRVAAKLIAVDPFGISKSLSKQAILNLDGVALKRTTAADK
jgi:hypothetical protein